MSPRTVLFLNSSSDRYGADRQLATLAGGLDPARYRPLVVLPDHGPLAAELRGLGIEVRVRRLAVLRRALFSPRGLGAVAAAAARDAQALGALVRRERVDLIHSNTSVTLGGAPAARLAGVPHVWHVREIYADFARWWPAYRSALLSADALPCVSEATRAQFGSDARAMVVPDAVPCTPIRGPRAESRRALGLPGDAFVCALLGRISSWKGQDVLAGALAMPALRDRGAVGLVAGDVWPGNERQEESLRTLAATLGVADRLRLLGFRRDTTTVLGAADVVVVPSTRPDPLPNAALEAAAAGCCVVASDLGGLPEILTDGETGRLVPADDPGALADALAGLADRPEERERLGRAAAADVPRRFSAERLLDSVQSLYDELRSEA